MAPIDLLALDEGVDAGLRRGALENPILPQYFKREHFHGTSVPKRGVNNKAKNLDKLFTVVGATVTTMVPPWWQKAATTAKPWFCHGLPW